MNARKARAQRRTPAVLWMRHTATTDSIVFTCAHGRAEAFLPDNRGAGALVVAIEAMTRCGCACSTIIEEWPSLAEALAVFEADDADDRAAGRTHSEGMSTLHALTIGTMREYACPECDPSFGRIYEKGLVENHVVHKKGCPRENRHSRREQWLDLSAAGPIQ